MTLDRDGRFIVPKNISVLLLKTWAKLCCRARLIKARIYDLRYSFASVGASTGNSLLMIGALLGHRAPKATKKYVQLANDPAEEAADRVSKSIAAEMKRSGSNAGR